MKNFFRTSVAALALSSITTVATAVPLNALISSNGSLSIGDKIFAGFGIIGVDATAIDVSANITAGVYNLMFTGPLTNNGGTPGNPNNPTVALVSFTIETVSGLALINEIDQTFGLVAEGTGGEVQILEIVRTGDFTGPEVGRSAIGFTLAGVLDPSDPPAEVGDTLILPSAQSKLFVSTSIILNALPNGVVGATFFNASFHQTDAPGGGVPEGGSSLLLLGLALSCIGLLRKWSAA